MANKKISELPYINGGEISGNTLIPLVTYFSATTGDTVHTFVDDFQTYLISGLTGNTDVFVTGGTYSAGTITFTNNTGGTFNVTGVTFSGGSSVVGDYLPLSGGTVTGSTQFTVGLSASTISATTYQNLPTDIRVTGGTYSAGTITFTNNTGGTFNVTGFTTGSTSTISGDYLPLSGGTVTGQTFFTSGVTITGDTFINDTTGMIVIDTLNRYLYDSTGFFSLDWENRFLTDDTNIAAIEWKSTKRKLIDSGSTVSIDWNLRFAYDDVGTESISWSTTKRKLIDSYSTDSVNWEERFLIKSDGTQIFDWENGILTGQTNIQSSTISATTYQNLPTDIRVTGGTYTAGTITFTNNTGGTFNITGLTTGSTSTISGDYLPLSGGTVSGTTYFTQGVSGSTVSATTFNFNTGFTGSTLVGQMTWNQDFGVPQVGMVGGNVVQKVGESVYAYVKNVDSTTLNKGEVVYAFGASGDKMSVKRASNTGDTTSAKTLGIVAESIAVNGLGYVITQGTIDGLNLGSYTDGDLVWLSSVPGQFTKTKQYAPYHLVFVGVVQKANAGNGQLYVKPQNGYELEEIHDVIATGATYGDILVYSAYGSNDVWVSTKTLNGSYTITGNTNIGGNLTVSGTTFLKGLSATTISATTIGTSGDCIDDIYVSNIHSCSPLNINPLNEGNVYFGSTSAVTIDLTNNRVGIGTNTPSEKLDVSGKTKTISLQVTSGASVGYVLTAIDSSGNTQWIDLGTNGNELDPVLTITGVTASTINIGDRFLISGGTGIWSGRDNQIAEYTGAGPTDYSYYIPILDDVVFVTDTLSTLRFNGTSWIAWRGTAILQNGNSLTTSVNIGTNNARNLTFRTSGQTRMLISGNTGNVYIGTGTTLPIDQKLLVDGNIKIADSRYYGYSGGTGTTITGRTLNIRHTAVNTHSIVGGPNDESITFGPTNRIFIQAGEVPIVGALYVTPSSGPALLGGNNTSGFQIFNAFAVQANTTRNGIIFQQNISWNGGTGTTSTSTINSVKISPTANMVTGTTNGNLFVLDPTINYTGGTLNLRGLYYNPTVSATTSAFTETAIETVRGNVLLNTLSGNTGIGTTTPSEKLDVSGKTKTTNLQVTSGATAGYVLTSDASGNATWQLPTGGGTFTGGTVSGSTQFTNGLTANTISATTYQNLPDNVTGNYLPLSGGTVSGNTTITANLTVSGNSGINWFSSNTSSDLVRITQTGLGNAFVVEDNTNPDSTPFIINSGGSVSVGTTSVFSVGVGGAETKLNVSNGSSGVATTGLPISTVFLAESTIGTSIGLLSPDAAISQIYFGTPSDTFGSFLRWDYTNTNLILATANSTGKLIFQTANAVEVARIDQSGNMGIGLTGATQKLEVSGNTRIYGSMSADTISATTYQNLPDNVTGRYLPLSGGTVTGNTIFTSGLTANTLNVTGNTNVKAFTGTTGYISGSGQNILTVIGSGNSTTSPLFSVQGSSGELFSVTDSLVGSLFSVNDISGLPILETFSDNTTLWGSYQAPSLNTTTRTSLTAGTNTIYSIPTSAYTGAFYEYTLISSGTTGARAGQIMSIWSGTTANFTETSTTDIGTTTGVTFTVAVSGNNAVLSSSATTAGWTVKTIIRSI